MASFGIKRRCVSKLRWSAMFAMVLRAVEKIIRPLRFVWPGVSRRSSSSRWNADWRVVPSRVLLHAERPPLIDRIPWWKTPKHYASASMNVISNGRQFPSSESFLRPRTNVNIYIYIDLYIIICVSVANILDPPKAPHPTRTPTSIHIIRIFCLKQTPSAYVPYFVNSSP